MTSKWDPLAENSLDILGEKTGLFLFSQEVKEKKVYLTGNLFTFTYGFG